MKILCISDTHGFHNQLIIPEGIDMIIHAGDISNHKEFTKNSIECINFLNWYSVLNIKHKILIPGNHDGYLEWSLDYNNIDSLKANHPTINFLFHEETTIKGIKIFGSPYTPTFFSWSFMRDRSVLHRYWNSIPSNTDILITHGPPKGILDLAYGETLEYCGDKSLLNKVLEIQPQYHIFGHIHENEDCYNKGTRTLDNCKTTFINASCVTDGKFNKGLTSQGIIINI